MAAESSSFRRVFESSPDLYLLLSPSLHILDATDAYLRATMSDRASIVGRHLFEVFPDDPSDQEATGTRNLRRSLESVLETHSAHRMPIQKYSIRLPDSDVFEERHWSPINVPVLDESGKIESIIHRVEDVTEAVRLAAVEAEHRAAAQALEHESAIRRQAEEELDRFFTLSLDLLCISSGDGYFHRLSPAFTDTLGWSVEELLARPYLDFIHPEDHEPTLRTVERQLRDGEKVFQFENRFCHRDGSWRTLSWKSVPQDDGLMYACARDVTELRAAEQEISELNEGLLRRAADLEAARREAERANHAKSEFLSRMSHELRTPLNAILGYAQLLELRSDDPRVLESTTAIMKGGRHLLELINEVLDLARIEVGKLAISLEPVPVASSIVHAIDLVRPQAKERGISVVVASDPYDQAYVQADRQRLLQVLLNLLSNAVKYNRAEGRIEVRSYRCEPNRYRIEISDNGTGVGLDAEEWLFQPFERAEGQTVEGTGLGLALSKNLMRLMGGDLTLQSSSDQGSVFAMEFRTAHPPELRTSSPSDRRTAPSAPFDSPLRIVYIEDNLPNLRLLESVFTDLGGIELRSAMRGDIGLRLVEEAKPDAILLDLHLPDMPGVEVLRQLKAKDESAQIPVLVISADATDTQIKRLRGAGAAAYLTKPVELRTLMDELDKVRAGKKSEINDDRP